MTVALMLLSMRQIAEEEEEEDEEEEEEEEELNNVIKTLTDDFPPVLEIGEDDDLLPDFERLLSGEMDILLPVDKFDLQSNTRYATDIANNESELLRLRNLVKELQEREEKLEGELLEYYGLKEQESDVAELQRQQKIKSVEIEMLQITINSLQAERKKLQEEVAQNSILKKELEAARNKIKEFQRQMQQESSQTKNYLLILKQQVTELQAKEAEASKKDAEIEKKLKAAKELEVEVVELRRKSKELQHEKRELVVKLDAAEGKVASWANKDEVWILI